VALVFIVAVLLVLFFITTTGTRAQKISRLS
jgi:hypothetical protein